MSATISIWKFSTFFALYTLVSLVIYLTTSFTIPAWLVYLFILLPFYLVCILYLINFNLKYRREMLRYRKLPLYVSVVFQLLIILTSPANCYGWKQGSACYSFIQSHLIDVSSHPPHWRIAYVFPFTVFMYIISLSFFLGKIHVERQQ
jgi:hypothetical protein